jgi:hypothetical protein
MLAFFFRLINQSYSNSRGSPSLPGRSGDDDSDPVQIGSCGATDPYRRAQEILALTKVNWDSSEGIGGYPKRNR